MRHLHFDIIFSLIWFFWWHACFTRARVEFCSTFMSVCSAWICHQHPVSWASSIKIQKTAWLLPNNDDKRTTPNISAVKGSSASTRLPDVDFCWGCLDFDLYPPLQTQKVRKVGWETPLPLRCIEIDGAPHQSLTRQCKSNMNRDYVTAIQIQWRKCFKGRQGKLPPYAVHKCIFCRHRAAAALLTWSSCFTVRSSILFSCDFMLAYGADSFGSQQERE